MWPSQSTCALSLKATSLPKCLSYVSPQLLARGCPGTKGAIPGPAPASLVQGSSLPSHPTEGKWYPRYIGPTSVKAPWCSAEADGTSLFVRAAHSSLHCRLTAKCVPQESTSSEQSHALSWKPSFIPKVRARGYYLLRKRSEAKMHVTCSPRQ